MTAPVGASADYQNLSVIQNKIFSNSVATNGDDNGYVTRKGLEHQSQYQNNSNGGADVVDGMRNNKGGKQQHPNLQRSLSAESTQLQDGLSIPDHLNQPRRRDSGNWSGDRNSASSSSSTTLDGPYMYLMGKRSGGHTPSPTRLSQNSSSPAPSSNGMPHHQFFDAGYDSYSLSSTDSYPPKHNANSQLAKIPESVVLSGDCERLCKEADDLLEKSQYSEKMLDLESALLLCNTAAARARKALDAPYSNPHTMTFARMKHNSCVMRARSLHRRLLNEKGITSNGDLAKDPQYMCANDIRNMVNTGNGSLRHVRHNSKENILTSNNKSIEIYATLPKKGKSPLKLIDHENAIVPDIQPAPPVKAERESRTLSIFGRGRRNEDKEREKRSRSEDRNKHAREFSVVGAEPMLANAKDTLKKHKEDKEEKSEKDKPNKKQHKVRRKILMGGLIRRKNRSMPDLTDETEKESATPTKAAAPAVNTTVDDSVVMLGNGGGMTNGSENGSSISGYLSEGHFEYQTIVTGGNPNLERSKLMRKNGQNGLAMRQQQLTQVKVPPPPPLRTNSTLSQQQLQMHQQQMEKELMPPAMMSPIQPFHQANVSLISNMSSNTSMSEDSCQTIITTCAVVHQEQSPMQKQQQKDASVDEVDSRFEGNLDLPPYPSPPTSSCHSRQASEEFPPPPNELIEHSTATTTEAILAQLQQRQLLLKQQKLNGMKQMPTEFDPNQKSVKDLASRFEQVKLAPTIVMAMAEPIHQQLLRSNSSSTELLTQQKPQIRTQMNGLLESSPRSTSVVPDSDGHASHDEVDNIPASINLSKSASAPYLAQTLKSSPYELPPSQIAEEIREVEMLNNAVHQALHPNGFNNIGRTNGPAQYKMPERTKKKSVSFCDQVILVATADDDEDDEFIPNPILERVLRTANSGNGDENKMSMQQQQNIMRLQSEPQNRQQIIVPLQDSVSNENGYRQDFRAEAQSMLQQQQPQQQQQQQRVGVIGSPQNQMSMPFGHTDSEMLVLSKPMQSMPMTNGYNSPTIEQLQRSLAYNHNPMMNGMPMHPHQAQSQPLPQQMHPQQMHHPQYVHPQQAYTHQTQPPPPQQQQQQPQPQKLMNGMPSPYMSVPNMHYMKNQRVAHFAPPNGYMPNGIGNPIPNPNYAQKLYHQVPVPTAQSPVSQLNGFPPAAYHFAPMQNATQTPAQKAPTIKKVSFEPGTKGEADVTENPQTIDSTQAVTSVPTRVFNNSAIVKASAKAVQCNLCRKKHVIAPSVYCSDCEFYMLRFKPRV